MVYHKLIALHINDFYSSITFEDNYGININDTEKLNKTKKDLESKGYVCIVAKIDTDIQL